MSNPKNVKVGDEIFPINTDFRVALKCNEIAMDENIGDFERALAIIYLLFGEKGLNATQIYDKLIELSVRYISLGRENNGLKSKYESEKYQLDFLKCQGLIKSSFKYDYGYDPYELDYLHWYDFYNDLENLSSSELGDCCILSRVNTILHRNPSEIKNSKDRQKLIDTQRDLAEKYCIDNRPKATKEQEESARRLYESLGIKI